VNSSFGRGFVMKRLTVALLMFTCISVMAALGVDAASPSLYDDFSGRVIDVNKWTPPEVVREIRSGKLVSALRWLGLGSWQYYDLPLAAPYSSLATPNDTFQAVVRLNDYRVPGANSGRAALNLRGSYLNDGTGSAGSAIGDVRAWLTLRGTSTGVEVVYDIIKCINATCMSFYVLRANEHVASAAPGTPVTLVLSWDNAGKAWTFQAGSESTTVFASTLTDPQTGQLLNVGGLPHLAYRALAMDTLVHVLGAGGEVFASGDFDDVVLNGTLLDDFNGSNLDPSKWASGELVREVQGGALVSKARTSYAGGRVRNALRFINQNAVTAIKIDVTVTAAEATNARLQARALAGAFYNDGSGNPATTDTTGDIEAYLRIVSDPALNGGALHVQFLLDRCADAACNAADTVFTENVAAVTLGQTYTLQLAWDGTQFTYGVDADIRSVNPSTDPRLVTHYPPVRPPISHFKDFRTDVNPLAPGASGYMAVVFDNVYVNPEAAQIPRLARSYQRQVTGSVVSAGASLRRSGSGTITLSGIPGGATIEKAFLYWATIGDTPAPTVTFQGGPVVGTVIGQADDPFQGFFQSYAYRADVTSLVTGTGTYTIAGLPDGSGTPPLNDTEGASLVVIYNAVGQPTRVVTIHDGIVMMAVSGLRYYAPAMTGFVASTPIGDADLTLIVGDGAASSGYELVAVNTTILADSFGDTFHGADPATPPATPSWDTRQFDAITGVAAGATMVRPALSTGADSLLWVAAIFNVTGTLHTDAVGLFRPSDGTFYLDANASGGWDGCGTDKCLPIGLATDLPLVGDWNGSGTSKAGAFRPSDGTFYLDYNGSGTWEGCGVDRCLQIGLNGDIPLVGDWNGNGTSKVGAFRPSDGTFYLDYNGSGTWEGCGVDHCLQIGLNGDIPLVGDWNGSGTSKVGAFRPSDGTFYLDYNGNGAWDGCGTDRCLQIGMLNDTPLIGDWNGSGASKVGVFRPSDGTFYLDYDGSGTWEGCGIDKCLPIGLATDRPLVGDWDGSGTSKVGVFRPSDGTFYLDYNGSGTWEGCGTDRCLQIGMNGDTPLVGKW
jgi:hypothetical protein